MPSPRAIGLVSSLDYIASVLGFDGAGMANVHQRSSSAMRQTGLVLDQTNQTRMAGFFRRVERHDLVSMVEQERLSASHY